eukprot:8708216-Alexandrium_andersonii.AAC.1
MSEGLPAVRHRIRRIRSTIRAGHCVIGGLTVSVCLGGATRRSRSRTPLTAAVAVGRPVPRAKRCAIG